MRENNFDIVRLLLAAMVVLGHSVHLSGAAPLAPLTYVASPTIAVEGFFAISGFLIFTSYERTRSLSEYFQNRAWRILPGYWLSTALCLLIAFGFHCFHVGRFLFANLIFANFLQSHIPGLFDANPDNNAVNGALWTIKVELMFYCAVPLIVWCCRRLQRDAVLVALLVLSLAFRVLVHNKLADQLPGQLSYFMIGALISYHLAWFKRRGLWVMLVAAIFYALTLYTGLWVFRPLSIPALTLGACLLLPHVEGPARWGDFSYGTYVLHYPILQTLVALGLFAWNPWAALAIALCIVASAATFSWFFVEKPSLAHSRSRRLRQAALGATANYPPAVP